jgi:hypothetical protein
MLHSEDQKRVMHEIFCYCGEKSTGISTMVLTGVILPAPSIIKTSHHKPEPEVGTLFLQSFVAYFTIKDFCKTIVK